MAGVRIDGLVCRVGHGFEVTGEPFEECRIARKSGGGKSLVRCGGGVAVLG